MPGAPMVATSALGSASSLLASPPVAWAFLRLLRAPKILRLLRAALLEPIAFCFEGLPLRRRQLRAWLAMICSSACGMRHGGVELDEAAHLGSSQIVFDLSSGGFDQVQIEALRATPFRVIFVPVPGRARLR